MNSKKYYITVKTQKVQKNLPRKISLFDYILNVSKPNAMTWIPVTFQKEVQRIANRFWW